MKSGYLKCPKCSSKNISDFEKWQNKGDKWILYHENGWFSTKTFRTKKGYEWTSDDAYAYSGRDCDMDDWNRYMDEGSEYREKAKGVAENDIDCWKNTQGSTLTEWNSLDKRRKSYDKEKTYWYCFDCHYKSNDMSDFVPRYQEIKNNSS